MTGRPELSRRALLASGVGLGAGVSLAGCSGADPGESAETDTDGTDDGEAGAEDQPAADLPKAVGAEPVASGFSAPIDLAQPPGEDGRLYVVDQAGTVELVTEEGRQTEPFLDVTDRMVDLSGYEERGLLGIALHPQFGENGRVFVRYSAPPTDAVPSGYSHTFVLAEYRTSDGRSVDPESERRLLEIPEPQGNHNSGSIVFGPEGYLYVGVGDGGGANDDGGGHVADWYGENDGGNGQDVTENLLGSILRIDVDDRSGGEPYGIPEDNPLVGREGLAEQYAWGFRNPWGLSVDADGRLFVADVGQNAYEEVDIVEAGGNYGWNVREGTHCFDTDAPNSPPDRCPSETPAGEALVDPIVEYSHGDPEPTGVSIIGGHYYTGEGVPGLRGRYVFGDWRSEGRIFVASESESGGLWPVEPVPMEASEGEGPGGNLLGVGRDNSGELYVMTTERQVPSGSSGAVHRLVER